MNRPEAPIGQNPHKPSLSGNGFTVAAILAPGIALAVYVVGGVLMSGPQPLLGGNVVQLIGGLLFLLAMVSFWGVLPSLLFGGVVLALIQRFWPGRIHTPVFLVGGVVAATLYVVIGVMVHRVSPGTAMFFAPWASISDDPALTAVGVWTSLVLSGLTAGAIYATFVKRG